MQKTASKAGNMLIRKAGPFPVWVWAALAVAAWFLFLRNPAAQASGGAQFPFTPPASADSNAQQPVSGQGTSADNMDGDLLSALGQNSSSYDALLAALQYGGYGGYGGYSSGIGTGGGGGAVGGVPAPTSETTAPTIDSGTNNAPVAAVTQANAYDPAQAASAAALGVSAEPNMTLDDLNAQLIAQGRAPVGYPSIISSTAPGIISSAPTPTIVYPAPVDTPLALQGVSVGSTRKAAV